MLRALMRMSCLLLSDSPLRIGLLTSSQQTGSASGKSPSSRSFNQETSREPSEASCLQPALCQLLKFPFATQMNPPSDAPDHEK
jgi:hypothetical protein